MKVKFLLAAAIATVLGASAQAQTTLNLTGATAFRTATINTIIAGYGGAGTFGAVTSVASTAALTGSNAITFRGTSFNGVAGDTIIRCRFSGSAEGIRDIIQNNNVLYYPAPAAGVTAIDFRNDNTNMVGATDALKPEASLSDVQQTSTPFRTPTLTNTRLGVVPFVFLKSQGSSPNVTNVTEKLYRAVLGNSRGIALSQFTGIASDADQSTNSSPGYERVIATGRNDGSGTRATALIESGFGVSNIVQQVKTAVANQNGINSVDGASGDSIVKLQIWPSSDSADSTNNSILWGNSSNGNGGYNSGSGVQGLLTKDTSAVRLYTATGVEAGAAAGGFVSTTTTGARRFTVISPVSADIVAASTATTGTAGGAGVLGYNGVTITPHALPNDANNTDGLSNTDRYKITQGQYTLWTYERLMEKAGLPAATAAVTAYIKANAQLNLGVNGIAISAMSAERGNDGDVVTLP